MKAIFTFCALLAASVYQAQTCNHILINDDFSSSSGWTTQSGSGAVAVSGGMLNLNSAQSGQYNRAYKYLAAGLSDTYWKAQCDFNITTANPSGNGAGAVVMALTADTLDFMSYGASQNFTETNQDGIAVVLFSQNATDNDVNNWYFMIEQKKGNVRSSSVTRVSADSAVSQYYISLERISASIVRLDIYTNSARTTHLPGAPITLAIDQTITGLKVVQHGSLTADSTSRIVSAGIDNDLICDNNTTTAMCSQGVFNDNFNSSSGWTTQSASGAVDISGGLCNFNNAYCGQYNRTYKSLPVPLSDNYWKAESDLHLSANPSGNGAGAVVMALTAGTLDFMGYDATQSYTETSQDGMAVVLMSQSPTDNQMNNWYFVIESKEADTRTVSSAQINADASMNDYYLRFERTGPGMAMLSVFTDAGRTNHIAGSPITFSVSSTITGLNTMQHGAITPDNASRLINGSIDNDIVCDDMLTTSIKENATAASLTVYPNPFSDYTTIKAGIELNKPVLKVMDVVGREMVVDASYSENGFTMRKGNLGAGVYTYYILSENQKTLSGKLIVQ